MSWMGICGVVLGGIVAVIVASLTTNRPINDDLGSVSSHWIAQHRTDPYP
jgi:hypothetical protein